MNPPLWTSLRSPSPPPMVTLTDGSVVTVPASGTIAVRNRDDILALQSLGFSVVGATPQFPAALSGLYRDGPSAQAIVIVGGPALTSLRMTAPNGSAQGNQNITVGTTTVSTNSAGVASVPTSAAATFAEAGWVPVTPTWAVLRNPAYASQTLNFPSGDSCTCDSQGTCAVPTSLAAQYIAAGWSSVNNYFLTGC